MRNANITAKKKILETLAACSYALLMKLLMSLLWADVNKVYLIMFSTHTHHTHLERNFNNINFNNINLA